MALTFPSDQFNGSPYSPGQPGATPPKDLEKRRLPSAPKSGKHGAALSRLAHALSKLPSNEMSMGRDANSRNLFLP